MSSKDVNLSSEFKKIQEKLFKNKIAEISENKDVWEILLKEEIIKRYFYKEGLYSYKLKNDETVLKAVELLNNKEKYQKILSSK